MKIDEKEKQALVPSSNGTKTTQQFWWGGTRRMAASVVNIKIDAFLGVSNLPKPKISFNVTRLSSRFSFHAQNRKQTRKFNVLSQVLFVYDLGLSVCFGDRMSDPLFCVSSSKIHIRNDRFQVGVEKRSDSIDSWAKDVVWPSPDDEIAFWNKEFPRWDANQHDPAQVERDSDLLHVVHVTAEMAPIAKVGGLGDVVTGLARACSARGHKVDVMLPLYECIQRDQISGLELINTYESFFDGDWVTINTYSGLVSGIPVIFIQPSNHFFKGQYVYGGSYNELEAYLCFSRACLEWMQVSG